MRKTCPKILPKANKICVKFVRIWPKQRNSRFRHKAVKVGTTVPLSHSLYEVHAASRQATTAVCTVRREWERIMQADISSPDQDGPGCNRPHSTALRVLMLTCVANRDVVNLHYTSTTYHVLFMQPHGDSRDHIARANQPTPKTVTEFFFYFMTF